MKKRARIAIVFLLLCSFIVQFTAMADTLPQTDVTEYTYDCSSNVFMRGAVSGPQTIPKIAPPLNEGEFRINTYAASPLMNPTVYNLIYNALRNFSINQVNLSRYNILPNQLYQYFCSVLNDHPELFYVNTTVSYGSNGTYVVFAQFTYVYTTQQAQQMLTTYENKINNILSTAISPEMTTVEKILAIHDYIELNSEYDYANYLADTLPNEAGTAYGIIVQQKGVCQSYTLAVSDLLNHLGITSISIGSPSMNHVWNLINLDGNWYHLDATWDDPVFSGNPNRYDWRGYAGHNFFLINDATISDSTHKHSGWDKTLFPASTDVTYLNYWAKNVRSGVFWKNGKFYYDIGGYVYEYNSQTNISQTFYNTGNYSTNYLAMSGDWLYYTNDRSNTVSRLHMITKQAETIDTLAGINDIYIKDGNLIYSDWETDATKQKPLSDMNIYQTISGFPMFTDSNGKYLSYSDLTQGSTVNMMLSISKLTAGDQPSDILIQFYQGQKLVSIAKLNQTVTGLNGIYRGSITVPNASFDRISLFIWKLDTLTPYSIPIVMNQR